jgi:hypothetical protein
MFRETKVSLFGHTPQKPFIDLLYVYRTGPGRGKKYWYRVNEDQKKNLPLPNKEKRIFETKTLVCGKSPLSHR